MEGAKSPEMGQDKGGQTLGHDGAVYLEQAVRGHMRERGGALGALAEVDPTALTEQGREKLAQLEARYQKEKGHIQELSAKSRMGLAEAILKRVLEFLDLDTREKVFAAALEVIPYVGAVYAVTGRRIMFDRDPKTGVPIPKLEKISLTDRGLYLAGELLISGHVLRGIKQAVLAKGVKEFAIATGKLAVKRTGEVIVKRAQTGVRREIGQLTSPVAPANTSK